MTENVSDQTTSVTPGEQPAVGGERPPAPDGSVYLADVLAIVRRHANANDWCSTAEESPPDAAGSLALLRGR